MAGVYLTIGGVQYGTGVPYTSPHVIEDSLSISDIVDQTPNTCAFTTQGFIPTLGQEVIVRLDSTLGRKLFAGRILSTQPTYRGALVAGQAGYIECSVDCIDYTWLLDRRIVNAQYSATSASTIVTSLLSSFTSGFTSTHVVAGLATIDTITFTNETVSGALTRLAKRIGGYWYVDYDKDVHFYLSETGNSPTALTSAHSTLQWCRVANDLSQIVTRAVVQGGGSNATDGAAAGDTSLTVDDSSWYSASGGTVACGPQQVTYTSVSTGVTPNVSSWSSYAGSPSTVNWSGLVFADSISTFVAVGSVYNKCMTSTDGVTWTSRTTAGTGAESWSGVDWSPSLGLFAAVDRSVPNARFMTSPDGITWTSRGTISSPFEDVIWVSALGLFIAVGSGVESSPDGIAWTARAASAGGKRPVWADTLGLVVSVCNGGVGFYIQYSSNGTAWTTASGIPAVFDSLVWSPTLQILVGIKDTATYTSTNATSWTTHSGVLPSATWGRAIWMDGVFVASGTGSSSNVAVSADGIAWSVYSAPSSDSAYRGLAYASALSKLVMVSGSSTSGVVAGAAQSTFSQLDGIPAASAGSIQYAIKAGDAVDIVATVDDTTAQAALALMVGGDGIQEGFYQDGRLGLTEATARATAEIALSKSARVAIDWASRDRDTVSGATITANLPQLNLTGAFKIQQVTIDKFHPQLDPTYTARASSTRFTLEDLLRQVRG